MNKLKKLGIPLLILLLLAIIGLVIFLIVKLALFLTVVVCVYLVVEMIVRLKEINSRKVHIKKQVLPKSEFIPGWSDVIKIP